MRNTRSTVGAAAAYLVLTLALTWPLAAGFGRDVPADYGDPVLNMWILAWSARHPGQFDAPIFYPHPLALAYSDHLTPQALAVWPVLEATGNVVFAYDVLFVATFVLSGLGAFLLVRELTRDDLAAFVAGTAFAFAPYRFGSTPHVQVLSSMWMPFAILGYRRFFGTRSVRPLGWGALAWAAQNLSCGYYLFFFSPVIAAYIVWEICGRKLWSDRNVMTALGLSVAGVAAVTLPFLLPYARLRALGFPPRPLAEIQRYSADVYGWFTADPGLVLWGGIMSAWRHAEGALFPGVTIAVLALVGATAVRLPSGASSATLARVLKVATLGAAAISIALLLGFQIRVPRDHPIIRIAGFGRALAATAVLGVVWLAGAPHTRGRARIWLKSPAAAFVGMALVAIVMSFGPAIYAAGRLVASSAPYALFYRTIPGVDGLRVPARFGMIAALAFAVLSGFGFERLGSGRSMRTRGIAAALLTALICAESFAVPLPLNQNDATYRRHHLAPLPNRLDDGATSPTYRFVAALPRGTAIVELPLGEPAFDVRYMFRAIRHRHPIVNGYSGGAPAEYGLLAETVNDLPERAADAWVALSRTGASFAIVHEGAYLGAYGTTVSAALERAGAREVAAFETDRIFRIQ